MAKFYGSVGYAVFDETSPGVFEEVITEKKYRGDIEQVPMIKNQPTENLNDDITLNNKISIVTDLFADEHLYAIRYVVYGGSKWKVTSVELRRPRIILSIGGVYNG